jgi:hypothetical protein
MKIAAIYQKMGACFISTEAISTIMVPNMLRLI